METRIDAAVITHVGMEQQCADEVKGILDAPTKILPGVVSFSAPLIEVCAFCYQSRSAMRVLLVLGQKKASDLVLGASSLAEKIDFTPWLNKETTFACRSAIPDLGQEIAMTVGGHINDVTNAPVDLDNPAITVVIHETDGEIIIGLDLGGDELGKRDYRIFLGNESLRGTIAYGLLTLAGFDGSQTMSDVFCRSGIIPIEAALLGAGLSVHRHVRDFPFRKLAPLAEVDWDATLDRIDKKTLKAPKGLIVAMDETFGAVSAAQKNAKIAGVNTFMEFSRTDLQFLDAKFGKGGLDMIVTMPPQQSAKINGAALEKSHHDLFYQAEFILKKKGKLAIITKCNVDGLKKYAAEFKFMQVKEGSFWQGGLQLTVLVLVK